MTQAPPEANPERHADNGLWTILAKTHDTGSELARHAHSRGQLLYGDRGVMLVDAQAIRWVVPPQRALWIPPGVPHSVRFLAATQMRTVYFRRPLLERVPPGSGLSAIHAVGAAPLIRELIAGLFDPAFDAATHETMAVLLLQALRQTPALPTSLPMPVSPVLCRAVAPLLRANQWQLPMGNIAERAAMSERGFTRRFSAEVGLSFRAWRQRARLMASLDLLSTGLSVKAVARELKFAGEAAYVAAFRGLFGTTPGTFR